MRFEIEIPDDAAKGRYGVYVLRDAEDEILYIGHSQNLYGRLRSHRSLKPWWRDVRSMEWVACQGYAEARCTEKNFIALLTPRYNESDTLDLPEPRPRARTPELPDWTVARLTEMREEEASANYGPSPARDRLDSYIVSLRNAGWSLEVIGRGLGMTRERVRQRQARAGGRCLKGAAVPSVPLKVKPAKKVKPRIPVATLAKMKELQAVAVTVRGWTPLDDPAREASVTFTEMIAEQHVAGVSIYRISQQLGVTPLAISARLARHGYIEPIKGLPSNIPYGTPYQGRAQKDQCKAGHSLVDETNVQVLNRRDGSVGRVCKACQKRRAAEYHARKKASAA